MKRAIPILLMLLAATASAQNVRDLYKAGETLDYDLTWSRISGGA